MPPRQAPEQSEQQIDTLANEQSFRQLIATVPADHWAVMFNYKQSEPIGPSSVTIFAADYIKDIYSQGRMLPCTLMCPLRAKTTPPVPAIFMRPLEFYLRLMAAGVACRPISDKDLHRGYPSANWCMPSTISETAGADTPTPLHELAPAEQRRVKADSARILGQAGCWCIMTAYDSRADPKSNMLSPRFALCVPSQTVYDDYMSGTINDYTPVLGIYEAIPRARVNVGLGMMVPLAVLLHAARCRRAYLPLSTAELSNPRTSMQTYMNRSGVPLPANLLIDVVNGTRQAPVRGAAGTSRANAAAPSNGRVAVPGGIAAAVAGGGGAAQGSNSPAGAQAPPPVPVSVATAPESDEPVCLLGDKTFTAKSSYETSPMKLFLGDRGQHGLSTHWWYVDGANAIKGPYTAEQMLMAVIATQELDMESLMCGTTSDVKPPQSPSSGWFEPLHLVLQQLDIGGLYQPVTFREASQAGGSSRVYFPKAQPAAAAAAPVPVQLLQMPQTAGQAMPPGLVQMRQMVRPPHLQQAPQPMQPVRPQMFMQPGQTMQAQVMQPVAAQHVPGMGVVYPQQPYAPQGFTYQQYNPNQQR